VIPVLVAEALGPFLARAGVPADIAVTTVPEDDEFPGGDFAGVVAHVARRFGIAELERLPRLRVIANFGVGYDNIDVAAAAARGVAVANTPGVLTDATAELTWALILAAARRLGEGERLVRAGRWQGWTPTQLLGTGLRGRLLGIVALRPETRRLIDAGALATMKPGSILVNTARGAVIDEDALADALARGRPAAAALDVYAHEPAVPPALRALENVLLLPHLGSATVEARQAMWDLAWVNLLRGVRGEPLVTPVS
jgi:glyoxylate reductase